MLFRDRDSFWQCSYSKGHTLSVFSLWERQGQTENDRETQLDTRGTERDRERPRDRETERQSVPLSARTDPPIRNLARLRAWDLRLRLQSRLTATSILLVLSLLLSLHMMMLLVSQALVCCCCLLVRVLLLLSLPWNVNTREPFKTKTFQREIIF